MIGIYKITNLKKKVYIGQSIDMHKRQEDYICLDTNIIFRNVNQASKEMNISSTLIRNSCKTGIKAKNYTFKWLL